RAIERARVRGGGEHLGREIDGPNVLVPRHEPELHRRDPRDGLLVTQARVDRVWVAFELTERDPVADPHRCLPASQPLGPIVGPANAAGVSSRSVAIESFQRFRNPNSPTTARISTISPSSQCSRRSSKCRGETAFGTTLASRANRSAARSPSSYRGERSK